MGEDAKRESQVAKQLGLAFLGLESLDSNLKDLESRLAPVLLAQNKMAEAASPEKEPGDLVLPAKSIWVLAKKIEAKNDWLHNIMARLEV